MHAETARVFFHAFCDRFVKELLPEWVRLPETAEELNLVTQVFERLGFPGAVGSTDCTHVYWERAPAGWLGICFKFTCKLY